MHKYLMEWERLRRSSLARNTCWIFIGEGMSIICRGMYIVALARLLGTMEYGIYVGALAAVSIVSQYSPLGSQYVFLRYVSGEHKTFALYWGNILVTTLASGSLIIALLTWAVPHMAHSYSWAMVLCIALGDCMCAQLTAAAGCVFQAFERMHITAALGLLVNFLRALLAGLMLWRLRSGTAFQWAFAALIVSASATIIALSLVTRLYGKPTFSAHLWTRRMGEGFVFALSCSTSGVYNDIDKAMLGHYGMNIANGIYTAAYRMIDACTLPITSLHVAALPRFFHKGLHGVRNAIDYSFRIIKRTAPVALLSAVAMFCAAPVIPHLLGKNFEESVPALRWLCLLPFFRSFQLSAGDAVTASGHQKLRLFSQAVAAVFNFGLNIYLIPLYSWRGAAWTSLATDGLLGGFNWMVLLWLTSTSRFQEGMIGEEHS